MPGRSVMVVPVPMVAVSMVMAVPVPVLVTAMVVAVCMVWPMAAGVIVIVGVHLTGSMPRKTAFRLPHKPSLILNGNIT